MELPNPLPEKIFSEEELDDLLTIPPDALIQMMKRLEGDIMILGIAGKMGITLGLLAKRAIDAAGVKKKVIGVSRFSEAQSQQQLESVGIETIKTDLIDWESVAVLPHVKNVVFMAGRKFGTAGGEALTWAMNTIVPANVARHFRESRIVAFSTGAVYPLVSSSSGGCSEDKTPDPLGEYAQSCLGRERVFQYYSVTQKTPVAFIRLSYAIDMRYGVLHDLGKKIMNNEPVGLALGYFNCIWQGDANAQSLLALEHCGSPAVPLNITGAEIFSFRSAAQEMSRLMGKTVSFSTEEGDRGYLNNVSKSIKLFGPPRVPYKKLLQWQTHWLLNGGRSLGKPTHFDVSDGKY